MTHIIKGFRTFRGYSLMDQKTARLTPSMEDYLEMIYRLAGEDGYARVNDLASALNVQPPSTSRMVRRLAEMGHVRYQKYGILELTPEGKRLGKFLVHRHNTIEEFLRLLGVRDNVLSDTEKIEHIVSDETLECMEKYIESLKRHK
jgi:DtxR family Mn-dependent transcriptional regulator